MVVTGLFQEHGGLRERDYLADAIDEGAETLACLRKHQRWAALEAFMPLEERARDKAGVMRILPHIDANVKCLVG